MKKKIFFLNYYLFAIIILFFSCKEDSSVIMTPDGGEIYNFEIFKLNPENSFSYQENDFSSGESARLYLGSDNLNQNLYLYIKINKNLFFDNPLCTDENLLNINSIDLKLPALTDFADLNENLLDSSNINFFNLESTPDNYVKAYKLNTNINFSDEDNSSIHQGSFLDLDNLDSNTQLPVNISNIFDYISIDLRGYLISDYSLSNSQYDCTSLNYDECLCSSFENEQCVVLNDECYWNNPSNEQTGNFCFNKQSSILELAIEDFCSGTADDLDIVVEFNNSNLTTKVIELFSTNNSNIYNSPYLYIKYEVNSSTQEYINRFSIESIQSDYFDSSNFFSNETSESDLFGTIIGLDTSIINLVNLENENNLDCSIDDCLNIESGTIIEENFNDVIFEYVVDLNDEILNSFDEVNFYFNSVNFVFQDLDPNLDNWNDCGSDGDCMVIDEDGSQNNSTYDLGENLENNLSWDYEDTNNNNEFDYLYDVFETFDDFGLDSCKDQDEAGNNICDPENSLFNDQGTENNNIWDQSEEGYDGDGLCEKGECENFYDLGFDLVDDSYESGCFNSENIYGLSIDPAFNLTYEEIFNNFVSQNNQDVKLDTYTNEFNQTICGELHWELNCQTCSLNDPNGDNYSIDPNQDDYNLELNPQGKENNFLWDYEDLDNNQEFNIEFDSYEYFLDYGIDGIPDLYENYNLNVDDDNYDIVNNPSGTENNRKWDYIDLNGNNQFDIDYDLYEPFFDYGVDQLLSYQEDGFNSNGKQNNLIYDYFNDDLRENFDDYGLDQCMDILEIGSENCCDDSSCDNSNLDLNNDNYIIDPNNDNYDSSSNPFGTENNGLLDWTDENEDGIWSSYNEGEKWYDYGFDHTENTEETNYYANLANLTLGSNLYSLSIESNEYSPESDNLIEFSQPSFSIDDQLALWISSIERIADKKYKIKVNVYSLLEVKAFQFQLKHIPFSSEIDIVDNQTLYIFPYEFNDDNNNLFPESTEIVENGSKYIVDATLYNLPEFCENNECNQNNVYNSEKINLCYAYGIKSSLDFINDNYSLDSFINNHSNSNISNEFSNLILYFDKTENSNHYVKNESEILFEFLNQEQSNYEVFDYISNQMVTESMDSIKINVGSLIQKYINNDYVYDGIKISLSSEDFNFNNLSIIYDENDTRYNPRLEIFYSE